MRYDCLEIDKFVLKLEKKGDVYIFNRPENEEVYNLIWKKQAKRHAGKKEKTSDEWGRNRVFLLNMLSGRPLDFLNQATILDACSGLGRFSIAALEKRAKFVISYDGSYNGLQSTSDRVRERNAPENYDEKGGLGLGSPQDRPSDNNNHPSVYEPLVKLKDIKNLHRKHVSVQGDMENIRSFFDKANLKVDVVIHNMALQHTRDPAKTLIDLHHVLEPEGILMINFFREGTTSQMTYDFREKFLPLPPQLVFDAIEAIEGLEEKDINSVLNCLKKEKYLPVLNEFLSLSQKYSFKQIIDTLHFEDLQTPYLHNIDYYSVRSFIQEHLKMKITNQFDVGPGQVGIICAVK